MQRRARCSRGDLIQTARAKNSNAQAVRTCPPLAVGTYTSPRSETIGARSIRNQDPP
jgi:hypothetical protein